MSYCEHCGKPLPPGGNFCPACGRVCVAKPAPRREVDDVLAWILFFFLGGWGAHRFYLGGRHMTWGIVYLLTGALCGIGWWVDLFCMSRWIREAKAGE